MKMRDKRRERQTATDGLRMKTAHSHLVDALTQVRRARVALLRNPVCVAEIKAVIKQATPGTAKVLRRMLAEDMKLMRIMDRQARRNPLGPVVLQRRATRGPIGDLDEPSESSSEAAARKGPV